MIEVTLPDGSHRAYRDACPHTGRRLSDDPNRVLTREADRLICFGHGALFRLEDGVCVAGPCMGQALSPLPPAGEEGADRAAEGM